MRPQGRGKSKTKWAGTAASLSLFAECRNHWHARTGIFVPAQRRLCEKDFRDGIFATRF
jgi:hypothetical protein